MNRADRYMPESPYKGLIPYSEEDRLFFFGREQEREKITKQLKAWRLTVLYGASGVGKSSILRAGVAYHLRQAAQKNVDVTGKPGLAIIVFPPVEGELAKEVSWQTDPLTGIKKQLKEEIRQLLDKSETEIQKDFDTEIADLFKDMPSPPQNLSLVDTFKAWANIIRDEDGSSRLFIILDQFEEYLVKLQQKRTDNAFLDEFQKAINSSGVSTNFLISIREDSLASLDRLLKTQNLFIKNRLDIKHLNEPAAREAILKPVVEYNRQKIILEKFLDDSRLTILAGKRDTHKSTILRSAIVPYLQKYGSNVIFFNGWRRASQQKDSLVDNLRTWIKHIDSKQSETRLFVILDQFEEYFWKPQETDPDQKFINELLSVIDDNSLNIKFLISIREEWLPALDPYKDRLPDSCQYYLQLNAKGENFIEEKPINPNKVTPKELQQKLKKQAIDIEPNLDNDILEAFKKESQERVQPIQGTADEKSTNETELEVEVPYLQLVMTSLWDKDKKFGSLRRKTFKDLGSLRGIVDRHFNRQISRLSARERDIAARIFPYLVTQSGIKIALPLEDLLGYANKEQPKLERKEVEKLLDKLSDRSSGEEEKENYRILRSVPGIGEESRYEIFHDMLAKPILAWLSECWSEKEKEKAELIRQEAEKIAEKKIEDARQEAQQKIQAADLKVSQAELEVEAAKQKAKWWGLKGLGIAGICLLSGIVVITHLGQILDINNELWKSQRSMNSEQSIKQNQQQLIASLVKRGYQLEKQQWFLALIQQNLAQQSNLMGLLASALFNEKNPETIIYEGDGKSVWAVNFSPDGQQLVTGSNDGKIRLWNLQTQTPQEKILSPGDGSPVLSMSFSSKGRQLATGSADGKIRLWNLQTQQPREKILSPGDGSPVLSMSFSSKGRQLATGSADGKIRLWNLQTQQPRETVIAPGNGFAVLSISFNSKGRQLATGSADGKVRLWNLQTQQPRETVITPGDGSPVLSISFSSNEQQLSTASANGVVRLWNLQSQPKEQRPIISLPPGECLLRISFNRDGRQLAVVSGKQEETGSRCMQEQISLFDQQGNQRIYNYSIKKESQITRITFSPDGKQLATVSENGAVKIWPIYTFDELLDKGQKWACTHPQEPDVIKDISCPNRTNSS
jgi:WD40 repeat protein